MQASPPEKAGLVYPFSAVVFPACPDAGAVYRQPAHIELVLFAGQLHWRAVVAGCHRHFAGTPAPFRQYGSGQFLMNQAVFFRRAGQWNEPVSLFSRRDASGKGAVCRI